MSCPSCGATLTGPGQRCPSCDGPLPVEGALAPDPNHRAEPLREIPGLRKKEKTWKDEVRDRVRDRRRTRGQGGELPLFRDVDGGEGGSDSDEAAAPAEVPEAPRSAGDFEIASRDYEAEAGESTRGDLLDGLLPSPTAAPPQAPPSFPAARPRPAVRTMSDDRPRTEPRAIPEMRERFGPPAGVEIRERDEPEPSPWDLGPAPSASLPPVERPAQAIERVQAAVVDLILLAMLWSVAAYFASRAARVEIAGLLPTWPYLLAYFTFLGLTYAGYFTGTTGQTLGKMATGLRVVDRSGGPPGYIRAFARGIVGTAGVLLAGSGVLPMLFDPARRTLHDRLFRTRVVKG